MSEDMDFGTFIKWIGFDPQGAENDAGAIRLALGVQQGKIILDFGTSVQWIRFDPQGAFTLGVNLIKVADQLGYKPLHATTIK